MAIKWKEQEVEVMLEYRDKGWTEAKIAEKLSLIFMRRFTKDSVNRKVRDLKRAGYIEANKHSGRTLTPSGQRREGEKYDKTNKFQKRK